jgi:hypothetical protein
MTPRKVVVRLSSQVIDETKKCLTEREVQRLVRDVANNADAGISSREIPDIRKLSWKSNSCEDFEIWYLAHDIANRVDVVALIKCSRPTAKASHQELIKIAFKVAVIGRLLYRMYQFGQQIVDNLLG